MDASMAKDGSREELVEDPLGQIHRGVLGLLAEQPQHYDPRMRPMVGSCDYPGWLERDSRLYYLYLNALVRVVRPHRVLELGTCQGGSTLFTLLALPVGADLCTVDIVDRADFLKEFGGDRRLRRVVANDLDLSAVKPQDGIDVLFIDTEHSYDQVSREWELYRPFLSPSAVVAFDDIHLNPEMERFWVELKLPKLDTGRQFHQSGFGLACLDGDSSATGFAGSDQGGHR